MTQRHTRSIRDIAHLYISTPHDRTPGRRIAVFGLDGDTFPGFHVANLAAAFAVLGRRVRVIERSGLILNAARFLALPPQVYAARRHGVKTVSALDRVDVWFADPPPDAGGALDLVHLPPLAAVPAESVHATLVVIAHNPHDVPRSVVTACRWVRCLQVGAAQPDGLRAPLETAGTVTRWERSLADVLPVALRDRESRVSRAYLACARRLAEFAAAREVDHGRPRAGLTVAR